MHILVLQQYTVQVLEKEEVARLVKSCDHVTRPCCPMKPWKASRSLNVQPRSVRWKLDTQELSGISGDKNRGISRRAKIIAIHQNFAPSGSAQQSLAERRFPIVLREKKKYIPFRLHCPP